MLPATLPPVLAALAALVAAAPAAPQAPEERPAGIDFARDIRPILSRRCVRCHGERKQKAGLRLDSKAAAMAGSFFGTEPVIVPGDSAGSALLQRVSSTDEDERMPPKGKPLDPEQIELLRRWIDAGAPWPEEGEASAAQMHWAYVTPTAGALPTPRDAAWARNEIDLFVLQRLEQAGLTPSPEADRATLLRRLSLDLRGLPPTHEEIEAFAADRSPDAYENLVDRLLASPHYGEHQARHWLDLARYADTNGYEIDSRRTMWRYRDWVIDAFNRDMPFDRFTIEQLAGDLLPDPSVEQLTATGFHRNTMINAEGGVDQEEYRVAAVIDRVNTTSTVWLGTTMACAQCHNHKYDPFSQRDYYKLFAYFNSTADIGPGQHPMIDAAPPEEAEREKAALAEIAELDALLSTWTPDHATELRQWEESWRAAAPEWTVLRPVSFEAEGATTLSMLNDGSILTLGEPPANDVYELRLALPRTPLARLRIETLRHETLDAPDADAPGHRNFVVSEIEAALPDDPAPPLAFRSARTDYHQTFPVAWPAEGAIDGDPKTGWAIGGAGGLAHQIVLEFAEPLDGAMASELVLRITQSGRIGRLRVSATASAADDRAIIRPDVEELAHRGAARTTEEQEALQEWFLGTTPSLAAPRARLAELRGRTPVPTALVMQELERPRDTHVFERGSFLSPGEKVAPGVPGVLPPLPDEAAPDRLGLARWLTSPNHPLVARVTVNRLWQQVFGRGIVQTTEDFGSRGAPPTHPRLLDWLAVRLQEDGWSIKATLRRIVLSATYRQSSEASAKDWKRDPKNLLLARGARYRVDAETVRDVALSASGLLVPDIGGPSVFPPQPDGIWMMTYSNDKWETAEDRSRFRRGMYTFWRRTVPYPTFTAFDATSRELVCVRRPRSNTPLQALALLNDPAFVEASVSLAGRMLDEGGTTDQTRIAHGFTLCTSRRPEESELADLTELLHAQRAHYASAPDAARQLLDCQTGPDLESSDLPEVAAWSVVANVLLNLDETITRS